MEIAKTEKNYTTNPVNNPPPPLPTTVELCTLCTQYVFAYTFQLEQGLKKSFSTILKTYLSNQKS